MIEEKLNQKTIDSKNKNEWINQFSIHNFRKVF
jgi:hypothetical protein